MTSKVALVTGGVGELGRAICERLAGAGCRVAAMDIVSSENQAVQAWQASMREAGYDLVLVEGDVTDFESCTTAVAQAQEALGGIDILINCAGITRDGSLRKLAPEDWNAVLRTNLDSVYNMSKQVVGGMTERGFGRIVNISSLNGEKGQFGQANYSAAKAGMHGFTMAIAQEVARKGVTVNTVSPGYMATQMVMAVPDEIRQQIIAQIPVGRLGTTRETAALVAYLASDDAAFITGANFSINGGQHMQH